MKKLNLFLLITAIFLAVTSCCFAQVDSVQTWVKQGIALYDAGNYPGAIEKYSAALKVDPNNFQADYEMGYTLYSENKGLEALPFLEKILKSNDSKYETYELMGSIYDDNNQGDKAVESYLKGIKEKPDYERLHFNLGISYLREKKFTEAEASEIAAIKLDPKHASAQRVYALAAHEENKRMHELLAWCSFLLLEPNSNRSAAAYVNVRNILNYGVQDKGKNVNIGISVAEMDKGSTLPIQLAVVEATEGKKGLTSVDSLSLQLTEVFKMIPELAETKNDTFFSNYYVKFFDALAQSGNMPAFTRLITLSVYKDDNLAWFKANKQQLDNLDLWMRSNPRKFDDK